MLHYKRTLQTSDTGESKLLMDHGHNRDLSWQKEQRSEVISEYTVPDLVISPAAGSCMTRLPKQTCIQPAAAAVWV